MIRLLYGAVFVVCLGLAAKKMKELSHLSLPSAEPLMFQLLVHTAGTAAYLLEWFPAYAMLISIGIVVAWSGLLASGIAIIAEAQEDKKRFEKVPSDFMRSYKFVLAATVLGVILETVLGVRLVNEMLAMSGGCVL